MSAVYCSTCRRDHERARCEVCARALDNPHALALVCDRCKVLLRLTRIDPPASALGYRRPPQPDSAASGAHRGPVGAPLSERVMVVDPRAHYVYVLIGHDDAVLYVGKTGRVWARINEHLRNEDKHDAVALVQTLRVGSEDEATRVERALIHELRPAWNVQHARG